MRLPERAQQIVDAIYRLHVDLSNGTDDTRRALMRLMAEQLAFELGPAYGVKSAGPGRPQGPSQIAYNGPEGLGGWRILDGDGSMTDVKNSPIPNPTWQEFPDQIFLPVDPIDHLGARPAPAPEPIPVPPPPVVVDPPPPAPVPPPTPLPARGHRRGGWIEVLLKLIFGLKGR